MDGDRRPRVVFSERGRREGSLAETYFLDDGSSKSRPLAWVWLAKMPWYNGDKGRAEA